MPNRNARSQRPGPTGATVAARRDGTRALLAVAASAMILSSMASTTAGASTPPDVEPGDRLITTIAGTGEFGATGDGGPARQARLGGLAAVAVGPGGTVYVAAGQRIRAISPDGTITTVAGTGVAGYSGDGGPATDATIDLGNFAGLAVGPDETVYVTDSGNNRVRAIDPDGTITTVAGNGDEGFTADGRRATDMALDDPSDVAVGPDGTLYIAESFRVRTVTTDGLISTIADGTSGGVDEFVATRQIAVGEDGSIYTVDTTFGSERLMIVDGDGELVAAADLPGDATTSPSTLTAPCTSSVAPAW